MAYIELLVWSFTIVVNQLVILQRVHIYNLTILPTRETEFKTVYILAFHHGNTYCAATYIPQRELTI